MKKRFIRTAAASLLALPAMAAGFSVVDPATGSFAVLLTIAAAKALLVVDYFTDRG
jgi:hypothetical protein